MHIHSSAVTELSSGTCKMRGAGEVGKSEVPGKSVWGKIAG